MKGPVVTFGPVEAPMLAYANERARWEKGVRWLLWIVCGVAWVKCLCAAVGLNPFLVYWGRWDGATAGELAAGIGWALVGSGAFCGLLRIGRMRRWIILIFGIQAVLLSIVAAIALTAVDDWRFYTPGRMYVSIYSPMRSFGGSGVWVVGSAIAALYPLVLTAILYPRPDGRRPPAARAIWWMTAGACAAAAAAHTQSWVTQFGAAYEETVIALWVVSGRGPWSPLIAIGKLAGTFAGFAAYGAIVWTLVRGPRGRAALKICAALLVVYAVGAGGGAVGYELAWLIDAGMGARHKSVIPLMAHAVSVAATWIAFAAGVRVALDLADVRARLEGHGRGEG
jgi:hypothetical protein